MDSLDLLRQNLCEWNIKHFSAWELVKVQNVEQYKSVYNQEPQTIQVNNVAIPVFNPGNRLVNHIYLTVRFADVLRQIWGGPVEVNSGYRPPKYNKAVGGTENSTHTDFRALDLVPSDQSNKDKWYHTSIAVHESLKEFMPNVTSGLGYLDYKSGEPNIHIDTNADHKELGRSSDHVIW